MASKVMLGREHTFLSWLRTEKISAEAIGAKYRSQRLPRDLLPVTWDCYVRVRSLQDLGGIYSGVILSLGSIFILFEKKVGLEAPKNGRDQHSAKKSGYGGNQEP